MRILVISDLHANLTALEAVLVDAGMVDAAWCLGDLVGYGPDPNECIERVRQLPNLTCILGNHDAAVLDHIDPGTFNPEARQVIFWTKNVLKEGSQLFLNSLKENALLADYDVSLSHGSPRHPVWEYLLDVRTATLNFGYFSTNFCFVGHTHLPVVYNLQNGRYVAGLSVPQANQMIELQPRSIVNPGSVGQPRDRDARAAYAIFDPERRTWNFRRVEYAIDQVQARMRQAGLPDRHITRLAGGW